jgi:SAM-dependent methyltransferase
VKVATETDPLIVRETRFGSWFQGTDIWVRHVLNVAFEELTGLIDQRAVSYPVVVDLGCGHGYAFRLLLDAFRPQRLIGVDYDPACLAAARRRAAADRIEVEILQEDGASLSLASSSVDIIFCHQTLHHLVQQDRALDEFYRILKPGGLLLLAESTKVFIYSWNVRWFFAHPMDMQRTAGEYLQLVRRHGFEFDDRHTSFPDPWWSYADLGMRDWLGFVGVSPPQREPSQLRLVARRSP